MTTSRRGPPDGAARDVSPGKTGHLTARRRSAYPWLAMLLRNVMNRKARTPGPAVRAAAARPRTARRGLPFSVPVPFLQGAACPLSHHPRPARPRPHASTCRRSTSATCARRSCAATEAPAGSRATAVAGARGRQLHDRARRVRRDPGPERLGQVDARPPALDAADQRRRRGAHLRPRRVPRGAGDPQAREPRLGRGELLQEDVRGGEPLLRGPLLRDDAAADARRDPGDPREGRLPGRAARRGDGEPLARHAAEGRARAGAPDLAGAAPARRADDGSRPALEARGAGRSSGRSAPSTTRRSCSAPTTWPRPRRSPTGSGSSTAAGCSSSSRSQDVKRRFGVETLEQAFFAATGREFEAETTRTDDDYGRCSRERASR